MSIKKFSKFKKITKQHIDQAIKDYISDTKAKVPTNTKYYILYEDKELPSKEILRRAYKLAYKKKPSNNFHGGKDNAHLFLIQMGYKSKQNAENAPKLDNVWIFPSNQKAYDVNELFREGKNINWTSVGNTKNIQRGDIVFIYISSPIKEIRWKCHVGDINFYLQKGDEDTHSIIKDDIFDYGPCIELIPDYEYVLSDLLSYSELAIHGLDSKLMGPQRLDENTYKYICSVEGIDCDDISRAQFIRGLNKDKIKKLAQKNSKDDVAVSVSVSKKYRRDPYVSQYAKDRANGICQLCEKPAPFADSNGEPYLETHHIKWLSRGGADSVKNTAALCPNCHKRMHILDDITDIKRLLDKAKKNK